MNDSIQISRPHQLTVRSIFLIIILAVPWLHAQSPPETLTTANDPLRLAAGFFKTEITPDKAANMFGYPFQMRPGNDGVLEPLRVRACALRSDGMPAVIVALERARDSLKASRAGRGAGNKEPDIVWLAPVIQRRSATFELKAEDCGTAEFPVVFRSDMKTSNQAPAPSSKP